MVVGSQSLVCKGSMVLNTVEYLVCQGNTAVKSTCVINCTSKTSHFRHKSQHDKILMWIRHPASEPARIFVNKLSAILFLCKSSSFQSILDETKWPISTSSPDLTSLSTLVHRNNSATVVCVISTRPTIFAKAQEAHTKSLSPPHHCFSILAIL